MNTSRALLTAKERKAHPIFTGVLKYFPDALMAVAELSRVGNEQHNPGQPLHWAKEKSTDEGDALVRHQLDAGTFDTDGVRHSAKVAWRALAQLQRELDAENALIGGNLSAGGSAAPAGRGPRQLEVSTYGLDAEVLRQVEAHQDPSFIDYNPTR
jgi:hypothetical protein